MKSTLRNYFRLLLLLSMVEISPAQPLRGDGEEPIRDYIENWLTPQQYLTAYKYIKTQMKDETQVEKRWKMGPSTISSIKGWTSIGPGFVTTSDPLIVFHGRVRCYHWYYNTATSNWDAYLGASSGGLWYGEYGIVFRKWVSLGDKLPNPSVGAFAVDPADPKTIFVGTGDWWRFTGAGLFKTNDRGLSWTSVELRDGWKVITPAYITDLYYNPQNSNTMWLSSSDGVFKSTDRGATWNLNVVDPTNRNWAIFDMVVNPADSNVLYAARAYGGGIFKTTNSGMSWNALLGGLWFTDNNVGLTTAIDISLSDPNVLYAAFSDSNNNIRGIYKTTNAGSNWLAVSAQPVYCRDGQSAHANVIRVHPTDPNTVYAGSVWFARSTDGGNSWSSPSRGHDDLTMLDFLPGDPNIVYIGSDGGLFKLDVNSDQVSNFTEFFSPGSIIQSYGFDHAWSETSFLVSGTQDNGTMRIKSAPVEDAVWHMFDNCDGANYISINPTNSSEFYMNKWCGTFMPRQRTDTKGDIMINIDNGIKQVWQTPIVLNKGSMNLYTIDTTNIYYSTNKGDSWQRANDLAQRFITITEPPAHLAANVTRNPGDHDICYVTFWEAKPVTGSSRKFAVMENTGTLGSLPVTRTTAPSNLKILRMVPDLWDYRSVFLLTDEGSCRLFRSTDAGGSFTEITGDLPPVPKRDVVTSKYNPDIMYVATDMGVFKTTNSGMTWWSFQFGLPTVPIRHLLYVIGNGGDPDTLRIDTFGRGFWQRVLNGDDPIFIAKGTDFPIYGIDIIADKGVVVGRDGKTAHTTDHGKSWTSGSSSLSSTLSSFRLLDSLRGIAVGAAGSIIRTTDAGDHWTMASSPTSANLRDLCFLNQSEGFAVGDQGTIIHTTDGGENWSFFAPGTNRRFNSVFFTDPGHGWIAGIDSSGQLPMRILIGTTDGGQTWNPSQGIGGPGAVFKIKFVDPVNGYLTADGGSVFKTTTGGQSWNQLNTGTQNNLYALIFLNPDVGWACGSNGTIIRTTDGGTQWMVEESGTDSNLYAAAWSENTIFAAGDAGILSRETINMVEVGFSIYNGWNLLSVPLQAASNNKNNVYPSSTSDAFIYQRGYYAEDSLKTGLGFWLKFDAAQNSIRVGNPISSAPIDVLPGWNMIGSISSPVPTATIASVPGGIVTSNFFYFRGMYIATDTIYPGYGFWVKVNQGGKLMLSSAGQFSVLNRIRIEPTGELPPPPPGGRITNYLETPKQYSLLQNFPNPFNPSTTIHYELPIATMVILKVYNIIGQEVATLVDGMQEAGYRSVKFNSGNLPSGIYTYRISAGTFADVKKMIMLK